MLYEGDTEAFDEGLVMEEEKIAAVVERVRAHRLAENDAEDEEEEEEDQDQEAEAEGEEDEDEDEDEEDYDDDEDEDVSQKVTDLRLIDFAHSEWTPGMGPDEGVVLGVKSTLALFERLLEEDYPSTV